MSTVRSAFLERRRIELLYPHNHAEYELAQVLFRLLSFLANGYLIRLVSNEVLGVVFVRLTLLYTTTQFLAREPLRKVCLSKHSPEQWPLLVSLIWLSIPLSALLATGLTLLWVFVLDAPSLPHYSTGCMVFSTCAILELLAEPAHLYLLKSLHVRAPIIVEAVSRLSQTVITVTLAHFSSSLLPFIAGSVLYSTLYVGTYWCIYSAKRQGQDYLFYKNLKTSPQIISLAVSFLKQSVLKQLLTEGEAYVMTLFPIISFAQQGVFSTISRLAAIVMRVGFKNIEDSYYLFFAQILRRGLPAAQQGVDAVKSCQDSLGHLLRLMGLFGLVITVYGLSYSWLALLIYGGRNLADTEGPLLLQLHCPYIAVCGINGITECFFFAVMAQDEVERYNYKLLFFSVAFLCLSVVLGYLFSTAGLVIANIANMTIRIFFSIRYINQFFGSSTIAYRMIPSVPQLMVICVCGMTALLSKFILENLASSTLGYILHIFIGGLSFVLVLLTLWECEDNEFKLFLKSLLPARREKLE